MAVLTLLLWTSLMSSLCLSSFLENWPIFIVENNETAVLPCIPEGEGTVYFWTKGETFESSINIASRVIDIPSSISGKYFTAANGSLFIFGANREDEGTYYCRIASDSTNCHGAVKIFVQVAYEFGINECNGSNDCVVHVDPSAETELTCSAKFATSSISLKWFYGSKEITPTSSREELNNSTLSIFKSIKVSHQLGSLLMCQAVDVRFGKGSAEVAYARLEKIEEKEETVTCPSIWVIPTVVLFVCIACVVIVGGYNLRKQRNRKPKYKNDKKTVTEEKDKLLKDNADLENEIGTLQKEIWTLNKEKKTLNKEVETLNEQKSIELQDKKTKIEDLENETRNLQGKIEEMENLNRQQTEALQKEIWTLNKEKETLNKEVETLNEQKSIELQNLQKKNKEIEDLKKQHTSELQKKNDEIEKIKGQHTSELQSHIMTNTTLEREKKALEDKIKKMEQQIKDQSEQSQREEKPKSRGFTFF